MTTLNEQERRRPDFRGGVPIRLLDGQEWYFVKPVIDIGPNDPDGYKVFAEMGDPAYQIAYDAFEAAETDPETVRALVDMSVILLQANYTLTRREVSSILRFQWNIEGNPEAHRIREEVIPIVLGKGPKLTGAGSDSPTSESAPSDPLQGLSF